MEAAATDTNTTSRRKRRRRMDGRVSAGGEGRSRDECKSDAYSRGQTSRVHQPFAVGGIKCYLINNNDEKEHNTMVETLLRPCRVFRVDKRQSYYFGAITRHNKEGAIEQNNRTERILR